MTLAFLAFAVSLIVSLLMVVRVWRASPMDGILSLLVPFYLLIAVVKYWSDPEHSIRGHAVILILCSALAYYGMSSAVSDYADQIEQQTIELTPQQKAALESGDDEQIARVMDELRQQHGVPPLGYAGDDAGGQAESAPVVSSTPAVSAPSSASNTYESSSAGSEESAMPVTTRPVPVASYADVANSVVFQRGRWAREATGFSLDVPHSFHILGGNDARRLTTALGGAEDSRLIGWVQHENLDIKDTKAWHVKVRWHPDGWIGADAKGLDSIALLQKAQAQGARPTGVLSSAGDLVGYAVAPGFDGHVVDWSEERLAPDSDKTVVDCHAVALGLRGAVEFTILGMPAASRALCHSSVLLLANRITFNTGREYTPTAPGDGLPRAPYTLSGLITRGP
ncbi:DUF2167 domain-containing protein [Tahibacter amnicola]|uniref:DUF2167 domain-containing protein n=1 Tax=Tahibacter amnicola TaxID=2976241 RepID=A0ABY6BEK5_9GAMM|nr:DUF2167 domain-containing protein [Tahibacter amnicola]UXI68466.1 DUF2167 domain-containing protein [Tahibacter amnicola]